MHIGAVDDRLPQFLNVPGGDWLRVGQLCGKHLETRSGCENSGWAERLHGPPDPTQQAVLLFP